MVPFILLSTAVSRPKYVFLTSNIHASGRIRTRNPSNRKSHRSLPWTSRQLELAVVSITVPCVCSWLKNLLLDDFLSPSGLLRSVVSQEFGDVAGSTGHPETSSNSLKNNTVSQRRETKTVLLRRKP